MVFVGFRHPCAVRDVALGPGTPARSVSWTLTCRDGACRSILFVCLCVCVDVCVCARVHFYFILMDGWGLGGRRYVGVTAARWMLQCQRQEEVDGPAAAGAPSDQAAQASTGRFEANKTPAHAFRRRCCWAAADACWRGRALCCVVAAPGLHLHPAALEGCPPGTAERPRVRNS